MSFKLRKKLRLKSCRFKDPQCFTAVVKSGLTITIQILQDNNVPLHFLYFCYVRYLSGAILNTSLMHNEI